METPLKTKTKEILREKKNRKGLHYKEIAEQVSIYPEYKGIEIDKLTTQVHHLISGDIKRNGRKSDFKNVTGKKGRVKNGFYKIKVQRRSEKDKIVSSIAKIRPLEYSPINSSYTGKAGEFAVISELLFNGFNAGMIAVDDGIDVEAMKNGDLFYIQVKTTVLTSERNISVSIKYSSFTRYEKNKTFYIIVIRHKVKSGQVVNDLIILSNQDIRDFLAKKVLSVIGDKISFRLSIEGDKFILNGKENVSLYLNEFERIN